MKADPSGLLPINAFVYRLNSTCLVSSISASHRDSNRLKTRVPQNVFLIHSQTLYPAELRACVEITSHRFFELKIFRPTAKWIPAQLSHKCRLHLC
jgi:hypothetical protein